MGKVEIHASCSIAALLSTIFSKSLEGTYQVVGLKVCPWCGRASRSQEFYPFCNKSCLFRENHRPVPLVCDQCEMSFIRSSSTVMQWAKRGGQAIYCSQRCMGKVVGKLYGFTVHPEHCKSRRGFRVSH